MIIAKSFRVHSSTRFKTDEHMQSNVVFILNSCQSAVGSILSESVQSLNCFFIVQRLFDLQANEMQLIQLLTLVLLVAGKVIERLEDLLNINY